MTPEETSRVVDVDDEVDEKADSDPLEQTGGGGKKRRRVGSVVSRFLRRLWSRVLAIGMAMLVVASVALVAALFYFQYRPDQATDAAAAESAISAATDGTVAILSYSPDTLDRDLSTAKSYLTGDFLSYYSQFTQQIVAPAARQKEVKTGAAVIRAAVSELHPNSAVVMVLLNQTTTSNEKPEPTLNASSILVSLTKVDGKWLISRFEPV